jgi:ABC-type thiamine transport system substrate-binding protein
MYCGIRLILLQKKKVNMAENAQRETGTGFVLWTLLVTEEESLNDWKCLQRIGLCVVHFSCYKKRKST